MRYLLILLTFIFCSTQPAEKARTKIRHRRHIHSRSLLKPAMPAIVPTDSHVIASLEQDSGTRKYMAALSKEHIPQLIVGALQNGITCRWLRREYPGVVNNFIDDSLIADDSETEEWHPVAGQDEEEV